MYTIVPHCIAQKMEDLLTPAKLTKVTKLQKLQFETVMYIDIHYSMELWYSYWINNQLSKYNMKWKNN